MGEFSEYVNKVFERNKAWVVVEENTQPKISVIVPCFNVEKYLEKCLESLVRQTYKDFEVICVDDGSTDFTNGILSAFSRIDKRIKFITQKNAGVSIARNNGLALAKGQYISFIDSDDWVDENYFESLVNALERNNCDIAAATIVRKRPNTQKYRVHYTEEVVYKTLQEKLDICRVPVCCYVWNKLYKAELIKNKAFKERTYFEDVLWTPEVLKQANGLVTVPNTNYYYRVTKGSIVKTPSKKKQTDLYHSKKYIVEFFDENKLFLSKKARTITKEIKYVFNIPVLRIKEFEGVDTYYLFNLIPIFKGGVAND